MRRLIGAMAALGLLACVVGCGGPQCVVRLNAGAEKEYVDQAGATWQPDQVFADGATHGAVGGKTVRRTEIKAIPGTKAPEVYLTERYGMAAYRFAVANGTYTVRLHFAETYSGITKAGERVFSVSVNGEPALKDLDVFKAAGGFAKPLIREIRGVKVTDGTLAIGFAEQTQSPEINGIEILAEQPELAGPRPPRPTPQPRPQRVARAAWD